MIECLVCGKKENFADIQDIAQSKWQIVGWNVKTADPKCVCNHCEYGKPKKEK
jgi:hypothetical protein